MQLPEDKYSWIHLFENNSVENFFRRLNFVLCKIFSFSNDSNAYHVIVLGNIPKPSLSQAKATVVAPSSLPLSRLAPCSKSKYDLIQIGISHAPSILDALKDSFPVQSKVMGAMNFSLPSAFWTLTPITFSPSFSRSITWAFQVWIPLSLAC